MRVQLSMGLVSNPQTWPILDETICPEGIDLLPTIARDPHLGLDTIPDFGPDPNGLYRYGPGGASYGVGQIYSRQLKYEDFDISEVPMTTLIMAANGDDDRWVGLPLFMSRRFFHMDIMVRKDAGIQRPEDLRGKQVGVLTYETVPPVWIRGMLQHQYGVHPQEMTHWAQRTGGIGAAPKGFTPPSNVTLKFVPSDKTIGSMLETGELDASLQYPRVAGRSRYAWSHPDVQRLFPDTLEEGVRYYRQTGLYPINHGTVIKKDVAAKHPWVIRNLFEAFQEAAELSDEMRLAHAGYHVEVGLLLREAEEALRRPLARHGVEANRRVLDAWVQYAHEQGLTSRALKPEDLFHPSVRDT